MKPAHAAEHTPTRSFCCPLCGYRMGADQQSACQACPLHRGCALVCCPACGYSTTAHGRSWIERWIAYGVKKEQS